MMSALPAAYGTSPTRKPAPGGSRLLQMQVIRNPSLGLYVGRSFSQVRKSKELTISFRTFLVGVGAGLLGSDPDPRLLKLTYF
jgi:hypothetical protein